MRRFTHLLTFLVTLFILIVGISSLKAQSYPNRPIQLVIPNVPGSLMDINARVLSDELGKILGTQVVIIHKPGAATVLGTDYVARSKKDGYTLVYTGASALIYARVTNPETVPYDPDKDLEPLGNHLFLPLTVTVRADSTWKTFGELTEYAKKNPGKLRASTIGMGGIDHFNIELIQSLTGAQFTHVPFKGGESVITALLGGHVEVTFDAFGKVLPHAEAGKFRILLLSKKMSGYPHIPTARELGYKQDLLTGFFAFYGPAGLPDEVKRVLIPAIEKVVKNPELKAKVEKMGFVVEYKSPSEMRKMVSEDYETANSIAKKIGLKK